MRTKKEVLDDIHSEKGRPNYERAIVELLFDIRDNIIKTNRI